MHNFDKLIEQKENVWKSVQVPIEYLYEKKTQYNKGKNISATITLHLLVSKIDSLYTVYKTRVLPIPLNTNNTSELGITVLRNIPKYLAISKANLEYLQLSQEDLDNCQSKSVMDCQLPFPRWKLSQPTCIIQCCHSRFQQKGIKSVQKKVSKSSKKVSKKYHFASTYPDL